MDRGAFDRLMLNQLPALLQFAIRLSGNSSDGEDLLHDAIERALRCAHELREADRIKPWMFTIVINCFRDRLRRGKIRTARTDWDQETVSGSNAAPPEIVAARELGERVAAAVSSLPARQREVIALVAYEGFGTAEAAEVLGITDQNARTTLHLAREKLKERLARYLDRSP